MRGNVYAVWETRDEGANALNGLQGRYYAGMQLKDEYLTESVICWTNGICTDYLCGKCARENECSFFHFFSWVYKSWLMNRNPKGLYMMKESVVCSINIKRTYILQTSRNQMNRCIIIQLINICDTN